jgi:hypothetical protein
LRKDQKSVRRIALLDGGLRGKARFTHPTEINPNAPLPKPLGSDRFQPGGRRFSAGVRKPPDPGNNTTILFFGAPASFFKTSHLDIFSV